jgi:hypothetical protein
MTEFRSFLVTADRTGQTHQSHTLKFTDAKKIAPARPAKKREIFHDEGLRDWFCWNSLGKLENTTPRSGERTSQHARLG